MKTKILIADDHEVLRGGIRALFSSHPQYEICGEAATGREAVARARELKPDLVIMDLSMPDRSGLEATRDIIAHRPETEILILSIHDSEHLIREAILAGAHGYVLKSDGGTALLDAVESLRQHKPYFTPAAARVLMQDLRGGRGKRNSGDPLTPRERQVLGLIADGKSSRDIAALLGISSKTADVHRANLMRKLDLHSVSELVRYAIRNHIVEV